MLGKVVDRVRTDRLCALQLGTVASHHQRRVRWPDRDEQRHKGNDVSSYEQLIGTPRRDKSLPPIVLCSGGELTDSAGNAKLVAISARLRSSAVGCLASFPRYTQVRGKEL